MNQKEIEIKLLFQNKKEIISKLGSKMKFERRVKVYDKYFSRKYFNMKNIHNLIRIREIKKEKAELTFKSKVKNRNNIWHRIELTTKVESPIVMEKILNNLGLNKIAEYKSKKEYWKFDELKIIFNKFIFPSHLEFMEIEGDSEKKIKNIIKKLGDNVKEVGEEIFKIFDKKREIK